MSDACSQLREWVDSHWHDLTLNDFALRADFHSQDDRAPDWQALHGDAGFRRYFRLASEPPLLAVYAPPATENSEHFIKLSQHLRHHGILTPAIAAADIAQGFMLIEDLGPDLLLSQLNANNVETLYSGALKCLLQLQMTPTEPLELVSYDRNLLLGEMGLFSEWFVQQLLHRELTVAELHMLNAWFEVLVNSALEQPQVLVHRDFHSRNLVFRTSGPPGVIDFQDAVVGPITYDLVSLLRDCYIAWPNRKVERWALTYAKKLSSLGLMDVAETSQFLRWFDLMGLQRHIKVLGIFARLSLRDGKHSYLNDLSLVMYYTLTVAQKYPEGAAFVAWFKDQMMPLAERQSWFDSSFFG